MLKVKYVEEMLKVQEEFDQTEETEENGKIIKLKKMAN